MTRKVVGSDSHNTLLVVQKGAYRGTLPKYSRIWQAASACISSHLRGCRRVVQEWTNGRAIEPSEFISNSEISGSVNIFLHYSAKFRWNFIRIGATFVENCLMAGAWPFLGTFFDHGEAPGASQGPWSQKVPLVFSNFWIPLETQKSTKNRSLAKKEVPGIVF